MLSILLLLRFCHSLETCQGSELDQLSVCKDLKRAFESRRRDYIAACSSVYSRVSTELAAYKNVEMERAKNGLEEHQSVCVFAASGPMA